MSSRLKSFPKAERKKDAAAAADGKKEVFIFLMLKKPRKIGTWLDPAALFNGAPPLDDVGHLVRAGIDAGCGVDTEVKFLVVWRARA